MKNRKNIPEYYDRSFEDIRTIPDLYDNLYPANDQGDASVYSKSVKKSKNTRKHEKPKENTDNF